MLSSCTSKKSSTDSDLKDSMLDIKRDTDVNHVKAVTLVKSTFSNELIANGKLEAIKKVNLKFSGDGLISAIYFNEGDYVHAGQSIAALENSSHLRSLKKLKLKLQQATLDYEDLLLRAGYQLSDTSNLKKEIKDIAKLRSNLNTTQIELEQADIDYNSTVLKAPFSGKIASLKGKLYLSGSSQEYFCFLINDDEFILDFQVLEQELKFVRSAQRITIRPFSDPTKKIFGKIVSINPSIEKSGMVSIKGLVKNYNRELIDGMNVKVVIEEILNDQLVVPRDAVLDRQNRKVIFTINNSVAKWNYVEIAGENSSYYNIKSGLKVGDKVIFSGNYNLANDKHIIIEDGDK